MFPGRFRAVPDYFHFVRQLVINSGLIANWNEMAFSANDRITGIVRSKNPLIFPDGSTFRFIEDIQIDTYNNLIERSTYAYRYQQIAGYYFMYERDPLRAYRADGTPREDHPELHLHVTNDTPRFMTHKTSFEEVFKFIVACFYTQEAG